MLALGATFGLLVVALLTFIALRVEQRHRRDVRAARPARCDRLHASELSLPTFERGAPGTEPLPAEDLPAFRSTPVRVEDAEELPPLYPGKPGHPRRR